MPGPTTPYKKRKLKKTKPAKLRRQAYALEQKVSSIKKKRAKAAKAYYKKNKIRILARAKATRQARK